MSSPATPLPPRTLPDLLLGILGGAMLVAAVVLLFVGGTDDGSAAPAAVPALELVEPRDGAEIAAELEVVFRAERELGPRPGGWGSGSLHVHLQLDSVQLMPAPADIQRLPSGAYRWVLGPVTPGEHALRLFWSGPDHRPLPEGASRTVRIRTP